MSHGTVSFAQINKEHFIRTKDILVVYNIYYRSVHGWNATCLQLGSWLRGGKQKLDCELRGQLIYTTI